MVEENAEESSPSSPVGLGVGDKMSRIVAIRITIEETPMVMWKICFSSSSAIKDKTMGSLSLRH